MHEIMTYTAKHRLAIMNAIGEGKQLKDFDSDREHESGYTDREMAQTIFDDYENSRYIDSHHFQYTDGGWFDGNPRVESLPVKPNPKNTTQFQLGTFSSVENLFEPQESTESFDPHNTIKNGYDKAKVTYTTPKEVFLKRTVYEKIYGAMKTTSNKGLEVGGLLKYRFVDDKLVVEDQILLEQEVSGADFEISDDSLATFMRGLIDKDGSDACVHWGGWWHSHHKMGRFWSGTDNAMFESLLNGAQAFKHVFGIVMTDSGDFLARLDIKTPIGVITYNELPVTIEAPKRERKKLDRLTSGMLDGKKDADDKVEKRSYYNNKAWIPTAFEGTVVNEVLWGLCCPPQNLADLRILFESHKQHGFADWTFDKELLMWGIDPKKYHDRYPYVNMKNGAYTKRKRKKQRQRQRKQKQRK